MNTQLLEKFLKELKNESETEQFDFADGWKMKQFLQEGINILHTGKNPMPSAIVFTEGERFYNFDALEKLFKLGKDKIYYVFSHTRYSWDGAVVVTNAMVAERLEEVLCDSRTS